MGTASSLTQRRGRDDNCTAAEQLVGVPAAAQRRRQKLSKGLERRVLPGESCIHFLVGLAVRGSKDHQKMEEKVLEI